MHANGKKNSLSQCLKLSRTRTNLSEINTFKPLGPQLWHFWRSNLTPECIASGDFTHEMLLVSVKMKLFIASRSVLIHANRTRSVITATAAQQTTMYFYSEAEQPCEETISCLVETMSWDENPRKARVEAAAELMLCVQKLRLSPAPSCPLLHSRTLSSKADEGTSSPPIKTNQKHRFTPLEIIF